MVEFALYYARLGWHVFPCGRKAPLTARDKDANGNKIRGTGGFYKATTDEDQIRSWWKKWPGAMIGIRAGQASGVFAIDPDGEVGLANWAAILAKHGDVPRTHQHRTPGGGHHLVFKWHADRPIKGSSGQMKGQKIDVKGQGGYFIAPPSVGKNGKRYEIADPADFFEFAEAPEWLDDLIIKKPPPTPATPVDTRPISERAMATARPPANAFAEYGAKASHRRSLGFDYSNRPFVEAVLRGEYEAVASIPSEGCQNDQLNVSSMKLGKYVAGGVINEHEAIDVMMKACADNGLLDETGRDACMATIESGMSFGKTQPKTIPERTTPPAAVTNNVTPINSDIKIDGNPPSKVMPLTFFDDVENFAARIWLLKDAVAKGETSEWIAAPGMLKSALMTDISVCIASGTDWRGYRSKGVCGVVYFALERADLVKRRLTAHRRRDELKGLPIAVAGGVIDLMHPANVSLMIDTIRAAQEKFGCDVGFVVIDTLAKGVAAGGGDENQAKDMGRALANLRKVQELTGAHIAIVSHTGKDEKKGARGSNSQIGDVDLLVQISGDSVKEAKVTKANDQKEGVLTKFKGEIATLGEDEDGDDITTMIISREDCGSATGSKSKEKTPLTATQRRAMDLLIMAINDVGRASPPNAPPGVVKVVTLDDWRKSCKEGALSDGADDAQRMAFNRAKTDLANKGRIGIKNEWVWVAYD